MTTGHDITHITLVSLHDAVKLVISSHRDKFDESKQLLDMIERIITCEE